MESSDYAELQVLLAKLKKATIKASNTDEVFKRYHQSSLSILETMPQHLTTLQQGLSIIKPTREEINKVAERKKEKLEPVI